METYGLEKLGLVNAGAVYRNLTPAQLVEHALRRGEGTIYILFKADNICGAIKRSRNRLGRNMECFQSHLFV